MTDNTTDKTRYMKQYMGPCILYKKYSHQYNPLRNFDMRIHMHPYKNPYNPMCNRAKMIHIQSDSCPYMKYSYLYRTLDSLIGM